jgi:hypothetical protein
VDLLAGVPSESIKCSLRYTVRSSVEGEYEAVSYTWGDDPHTERISIDGLQFQVTPNLASALKAFRRDESSGKHPRTLWVDAVCINQNDIQEKNQQVAQMQEIYAGAKEVLVWLSPSNPHLDTGILFLRKLAISAEEHRIPYEGVRDIYNLPISDLQPLISRYPVERFGRDWEHAFELLRLP